MKTNTHTASLLLDVGKIIKSKMEKELPVSLTQSETMRFLDQEKKSTMRALAKHLKITAPSTTAIVNELVTEKLVAREENKKDRREVLLHLTPHGKKVLQTITTKRQKIVTSVLSVLGEHDRQALDKILMKIITDTHTR